ncbi:MAG: MBL fold metallo-hydrolase [Acidobacteriaceae bacterium]
MTISWFGLSSFKIVSKDVTIITDPFGKSAGLSPVRGNADIVVVTDPENELCNNVASVSGTPFVVNGPGEFDIKGIFIIGAPAGQNGKSATIYMIEVEDIRIALLGPAKLSELSDQQMEVLEGADIALIPVGDKNTLSYEQAAKVTTQLEPYYIIPHYYKIPGLSLTLDKVDKFLQEMGGRSEALDKFTIKKKELTGETTSLITLNPQR